MERGRSVSEIRCGFRRFASVADRSCCCRLFYLFTFCRVVWTSLYWMHDAAWCCRRSGRSESWRRGRDRGRLVASMLSSLTLNHSRLVSLLLIVYDSMHATFWCDSGEADCYRGCRQSGNPMPADIGIPSEYSGLEHLPSSLSTFCHRLSCPLWLSFDTY